MHIGASRWRKLKTMLSSCLEAADVHCIFTFRIWRKLTQLRPSTRRFVTEHHVRLHGVRGSRHVVGFHGKAAFTSFLLQLRQDVCALFLPLNAKSCDTSEQRPPRLVGSTAAAASPALKGKVKPKRTRRPRPFAPNVLLGLRMDFLKPHGRTRRNRERGWVFSGSDGFRAAQMETTCPKESAQSRERFTIL